MGKTKQQIIELMETPVYTDCPDCGGDGRYEADVPMPHNAGRDVGYIDSEWVTCETCEGSGEVEKTCSECDEPMSEWDINFNDDETVCEECRHNAV